MHDLVRACSKSTAEQRATTAVRLELGSDDGLAGTIGFDGEHSRAGAGQRDPFATRGAAFPCTADYRIAPATR